MLICLRCFRVLSVIVSRQWRFRLRRTFFGLDDEYIENAYEQFFLLKYFGGWSFFEVYSLPIIIRQWFLTRLRKQIEREREQAEKAEKAARINSKSR